MGGGSEVTTNPDTNNPETETPDTESPDEIDPSEETPDGQNKTKYCKIKFIISDEDKQKGIEISGSTTTSVRNGKYFSTVKKPTVTCPAGWKLSGWSEASTGETRTLIKDNDKIESDKTLYGVFVEDTQTFKIPVFAGKFTFSNDTKIITGETTKKSGTISDLLGSTTLAENNDYVLKYWSDGTATYSSADTIDFTTVKALYAVETPKIRSVNITDIPESFNIGDTFTLTYSIDSISDIEEPIVKWSSSNTTVATVNESTGYVECLAKGTTVITLSISNPYQDAKTKTLDIELKVALENCCNINFETSGTIKLINYNTSDPDLWYSTDSGKNWTKVTTSASTTLSGQVYLKGNNPSGFSKTFYDYYSTIAIDGNCTIGGTVMSLLYEEKPSEHSSYLQIPNIYCFNSLFKDQTSIKAVSKNFLPATTLKMHCYSSMFSGCTSLITAPELLADTLADDCYYNMFYNCSSLITPPSELPALTACNYCYCNMFYGCTSLTTTPVLSATTLARQCYQQMFYNCTSLTTAPALPATSLSYGCYGSMFNNCSKLINPPSLPATTLAEQCYCNMFGYCTSLATPPELPATTLAVSCYEYMFSGCTALKSVPSLSATTLFNKCYYGLCHGCYNTKISTTQPSSTYYEAGLIFTCPSTTGLEDPVYNMFYNCSKPQSLPNTPVAGKSYYWYYSKS